MRRIPHTAQFHVLYDTVHCAITVGHLRIKGVGHPSPYRVVSMALFYLICIFSDQGGGEEALSRPLTLLGGGESASPAGITMSHLRRTHTLYSTSFPLNQTLVLCTIVLVIVKHVPYCF